jgi:hypothetical protein
LRPSSFVMCNTPVEVQFTSAGCLNYPCRTPRGRSLGVHLRGKKRLATSTIVETYLGHEALSLGRQRPFASCSRTSPATGRR